MSASPFWRQVEKRGHRGCWVWTGKTDKDGYGVYRGRPAHRVAWEQVNGPVPPVLDHWRCDRKRCVRPTHVKPSSHFKNLARAYHEGAVHSPRGRAIVEIGRRARAKYGETSEAVRRARKNYQAWRRRHAARDARYWLRRHALDRLSEAIGGGAAAMIELMIRHRELRDQYLTRRQRPVFEALLAEEQLLGTLEAP